MPSRTKTSRSAASGSASRTRRAARAADPTPVTESHAFSTLDAEQLAELLRLLKGADTVELKLSVPDGYRRASVAALGIDPLVGELRQVVFFDTPELTCNQHGVVLRARRIQGRPGDAVVKLRPVDPEQLSPAQRKMAGFGVEVDALPGGFVCSARLKEEVADAKVVDVVLGRRPLRKLFSKAQLAMFEANAPDGLDIDDLAVLGPINVLKLKFTPSELNRRLVAELWFYPDGSRILELSTKTVPAQAFHAAAEAKAFLAAKGIDLGAPQQTKTKTALEFFASELAASPNHAG